VTPLQAPDIQGLRADGQHTTGMSEPGRVGSRKPVEISREVWTSPELMLTVSSRDFDPRSGAVSYKLKNLKRTGPEAALMKVPAFFSQPSRPGSKAAGPKG